MTKEELALANARLKPCPLCGGAVGLFLHGNRYESFFGISRPVHNVEKKCNCRLFMESELFDSKDKEDEKETLNNLINAWNTRT